MKQMIAAIRGDIEVGPAVVVVVGHGNALRIALIEVQAGLMRHIAKGAIAVVAVEGAGWAGGLSGRQGGRVGGGGGRRPGLDEEDVEVSVVVIVEEGAAARRGLDKVVRAARTVVQAEMDSSLACHVPEAHRDGGDLLLRQGGALFAVGRDFLGSRRHMADRRPHPTARCAEQKDQKRAYHCPPGVCCASYKRFRLTLTCLRNGRGEGGIGGMAMTGRFRVQSSLRHTTFFLCQPLWPSPPVPTARVGATMDCKGRACHGSPHCQGRQGYGPCLRLATPCDTALPCHTPPPGDPQF